VSTYFQKSYATDYHNGSKGVYATSTDAVGDRFKTCPLSGSGLLKLRTAITALSLIPTLILSKYATFITSNLKRFKIEGVFKFLKNIPGWEGFQVRDFESY
jgi:hypothetical protein